MPLADSSANPARAAARTETVKRLLTAATIVLSCTAPLITLLARSGNELPDVYPIFLRLFAFNDHIGSLAMLAALMLALSFRHLRQSMIQLAVWAGEHPSHIVAAAFVVLAMGSRLVYQAHPLSMDEYSPWLQANAFARGSLTAWYPPDLLNVIVPSQMQFFIAVDHASGEVISKYWPGLALVMTPFVWLNIGWCANPAFGALALIMIYRLASDAAGDRTAGGWAMLAALASPQFTINAISYYAMPGELALNLLFLWLLLKPPCKAAFAAGLVGGLAMVMHNPAPHALVAAPCLIWLAWDRQRWPRLFAVLVGYLPLAITLGLGWSALMSAMNAADKETATPVYQSIIAGTVSFVGSFLTLPDTLLLTARWFATWKAWIWACPGLLLVLLIPRAKVTCERLLIAGLATTFLFFLFVRFDQGHGWGYRYIHGAWGALPIVAGIWLATTTETARQFGGAIVAAGLLATPIFMWQSHGTIDDALSWRLTPSAKGDWVIFVSQGTGRYRIDLIQNPPGQTNLLYLVSNGPSTDRTFMARHFPEAAEVERDRRGSAWLLPDGLLTTALRRDAPPVPSQ